MVSELNTNIRGYGVGEISSKGAVTVEIVAAGLGVPLQAFIDAQYLDSQIMDKRPGMYLKYLPYRYDEVTGKLLTGGSYLFDTLDDAKEYARWTAEDFEVGEPKVKFREQSMFESIRGWVWEVVGAHCFVPLEKHAVGHLQQWSYSGNDWEVESALWEAYPTLRAEAMNQGAASIWLLHSPDEKMVGIQLGFTKEKAGTEEIAARESLAYTAKQPSLEKLLPQALGLVPQYDRISLFLTLWLPKSRAAGGTELSIPFYPMVPDITHKHL